VQGEFRAAAVVGYEGLDTGFDLDGVARIGVEYQKEFVALGHIEVIGEGIGDGHSVEWEFVFPKKLKDIGFVEYAQRGEIDRHG